VNTNTGDVYRVLADLQPVELNGRPPEGPAELRALRDRFAEEFARGEIVPVSEQAAQTVLLGHRERRRRRRQAAKASRKRNR
jgi:hypothetical protein